MLPVRNWRLVSYTIVIALDMGGVGSRQDVVGLEDRSRDPAEANNDRDQGTES